jgi:hypothetical protein
MADQTIVSGVVAAAQLPLWIKLVYSAFVCVLVPVYWVKYGPANFLWFSDIALFLTLVALWWENSLIASMMALAVVLLETGWNVGFFGRLIFGVDVTGLAAYMFESHRPLYLRALSLFHVVLPVLLVWLVWRLGYDRRALLWQTALAWVVLVASYLVSRPQDNINWVYGFGTTPQKWMPPLAYLGVMMVAFPLLVYLPSHLLLARFFALPAGQR